MTMWRLLAHAMLRFHLSQPWQLGLALAGISLGVAVFVGIQLANGSAERAFELSSSAVRGIETHRLLPLGDKLSESVYEQLVLDGYGPSATPLVTLNVVAAGERYQLIGIDPIKEMRFRRFLPKSDDPAGDLLRLMTEADGILIPSAMGATLGVLPGDRVSLSAGSRTREFTVLGEIQAARTDTEAELPILADIGTAQSLTARDGLSRIDLALSNPQGEALADAPPRGTVLVEASSRNTELESMTRAFTTNLTALGLLALVVGMFLIHATMSFSVLRRQSTIATLRALGLTRREVMGGIVVEAITIGAVAGIAGAALGQMLADGLVGLVLRTMNDLAFSRSVAGAGNPAPTLLLGAVLGICSTAIAAAVPAREAARLAPAAAERRSDTEHRALDRSRRSAWLALPTLLAAAVVLAAWPQSLVPAFCALFLVLAAGAMCIPAVTTVLMRIAEPLARLLAGLAGTMAVRAVIASLSRTGIATAALAVAVATVMSIGLMVGSFRSSLTDWLQTTLTADMYIQLEGTADPATVDAWVTAIGRLPEVRGISLTQRTVLPEPNGEISVRAATPGPDGWGLDLLEDAFDSWDVAISNGGAIVVTEPFAYRRGLKVGDSLTLPTDAGPGKFPVAGIARDYNAAGSSVIMSIRTYQSHWTDRKLAGIGVHLSEESEEPDVARQIRAMAPSALQVAIRSTRAIRQISLTLFDRTFEVTAVLRALAGIVAFFGVLSAILALQLERKREFQVLRSIGMSVRQLRLHVVAEATLLGLAAGIAAIPIGGALAWLLVFVINRRSFGWTMDFVPAAQPIGYGITVALGAALLAGLAAAAIGIRARGGVMAHDE